MYTIENEYLKATFINKGAQLTSLIYKDNNIDYIFDGNPQYWSYHTPPLFPIVGKVNNNIYTIDHKQYQLPQHGLARLYEHELVSITDHSISFIFKANLDTLEQYPYLFSFKTIYQLVDNEIKISYHVNNTDTKIIYFQLGAHPAFSLPFSNQTVFDDYYFEFEHSEIAYTKLLNEQGQITYNKQLYLNNEKIIPINKDLFKNDALVFENLSSKYIYLKSDLENTRLKFVFEQYPLLALWSKPDGAPFVCIEPWHSHADYENFKGDFKEKVGVISLDSNNEFSSTYSLIIESNN